MKTANVKIGTFKGYKVNEKNIQIGVAMSKETLFGDQENIEVLTMFKPENDDESDKLIDQLNEYSAGMPIAVEFTYNASVGGKQNNKAFLNTNVQRVFDPDQSSDLASLLA